MRQTTCVAAVPSPYDSTPGSYRIRPRRRWQNGLAGAQGKGDGPGLGPVRARWGKGVRALEGLHRDAAAASRPETRVGLGCDLQLFRRFDRRRPFPPLLRSSLPPPIQLLTFQKSKLL